MAMVMCELVAMVMCELVAMVMCLYVAMAYRRLLGRNIAAYVTGISLCMCDWNIAMCVIGISLYV